MEGGLLKLNVGTDGAADVAVDDPNLNVGAVEAGALIRVVEVVEEVDTLLGVSAVKTGGLPNENFGGITDGTDVVVADDEMDVDVADNETGTFGASAGLGKVKRDLAASVVFAALEGMTGDFAPKMDAAGADEGVVLAAVDAELKFEIKR